MKTSSALSPTVIFLVFFNGFTLGQTTRESTCSLTATYNETLLAELAKHFDKDSSTVIIEYTLSFNSDFDYSNRSASDAFQPWKWYRTQGKYSSQLLLSYELYYGLLKTILYGNIKAVTIHVDVSPAGCFHQLENKEIEAVVLNFLLKDFRIDGNTVAYSFTYSEDVEICTARLGEGVSWGALIYKCCGYDSTNRMYCDDVAAKDWMLALIIFVIVITSLVTLYIPLIVPTPYIEEDFYYTPKNGNGLVLNIKVEKNACSQFCDCSEDDSERLSVNHLAQMDQFYAYAKTKLQLDDKSQAPEKSYTVQVEEVCFVVSTGKLVSGNERTISVFRNVLDFFVDNEHHKDCLECVCARCTFSFRRILRFGFMVALALPSFPLAYAMCAEGMWHRQVADANESMGHSTHLYQLWRVPTWGGRVLAGFVYGFYLFHIFLQVFCQDLTKQFYKHITVSRRKQLDLDRFKMFFLKMKWLNIKTDCCIWQKCCFFCKSLLFLLLVALLPFLALCCYLLTTPLVLLVVRAMVCSKTRCSKCVTIIFNIFFLPCALAAVFIFLIGINFFLHVAVMIITILVVQSSLLYEVTLIILLLIFYIWDSFNQVQNPFNEFMKALLDANFFKKVHDKSMVRSNAYNGLQNVVDGTDSNKGKQKAKKLIEVKNGTLLLNVKEPFMYMNEFKVSKKFFLHCAKVDYPGVPGTLMQNYEKAIARFLKIAFFIVFVFLVMMAFGHISYISPTSRAFLTFFAGLLPHILNKFSNSYKPFTKDMYGDGRFLEKLNKSVESFQEKWKVRDIYVKEPNDTTAPEETHLTISIPSCQQKCPPCSGRIKNYGLNSRFKAGFTKFFFTVCWITNKMRSSGRIIILQVASQN